MEICITAGKDLTEGEIEVTVTMRGKVDKVIAGLVRGLPSEALEDLAASLQLEARRKFGHALIDATLDQQPATVAEECRDDRLTDAARERQ